MSLKESLRPLAAGALMLADPASAIAYRRLLRSEDAGAIGTVRVRQLGGQPVALRPGTSDARVLWDTFVHGYHLPPAELGAPACIWDVGANVGLTMADFAHRFPRARVYGVELDGENARLARRNTAPWAGRCTVIEGAVWTQEGAVRYERHANASGYTVALPHHAPRVAAQANARTLDALLAEHGVEQVDYLKLDVEGGEHALLKAPARWPSLVRCLKVEVHYGYTPDECAGDLERLGFLTRRDDRHRAAVIGLARR